MKFRFWIACILAIGLFFRFVNLDRKVFWLDETYTALRVSGYTEAEMVQELSQAEIGGIKQIQTYQQLNPQKSVADTIQGLAKEEPQMPPLYFVLSRGWAHLFGSSPASLRSLAAVLSLFALPAIYWLAWELFYSPGVATVAMGLFAISPFQILYAQEARPYSLWNVWILLSSASLLRAIHQEEKGKKSGLFWGIYAGTIALGLYTHLYTVLVTFAQGLYVLIHEFLVSRKFRITRRLIQYVLVSLAGVLAFAPWAWVLISNWGYASQATGWLKFRLPISSLLISWTGNMGRQLIDFNLDSNSPRIALMVFLPALLGIIGLVIYGIYQLVKQTSFKTWLFILLLGAVPTLPLVLQDVISGGTRSAFGRYLLPFNIAIILIIAYLFASQIWHHSGRIWQQQAWKIGLVTLTTLGIFSSVLSSQAQVWWNKYNSENVVQVVRIMNESEKPLLMIDRKSDYTNQIKLGNLMSMSHLLDSKVQFKLLTQPQVPDFPGEFSDRYFFYPSEELQAAFKSDLNFDIQVVYQNDQVNWLWQVKSDTQTSNNAP